MYWMKADGVFSFHTGTRQSKADVWLHWRGRDRGWVLDSSALSDGIHSFLMHREVGPKYLLSLFLLTSAQQWKSCENTFLLRFAPILSHQCSREETTSVLFISVVAQTALTAHASPQLKVWSTLTLTLMTLSWSSYWMLWLTVVQKIVWLWLRTILKSLGVFS